MEQDNALRTATFNFLTTNDQLTAVIASTTTDHKPHTNVVYYHIDQNFNVYFLTATTTQKYQNLCARPAAAFTIGFGPGHTTVQGSGEAALLEKGSMEEKTAITQISNRMSEQDASWPVFQLEEYEDQAIAVFKITIEKLHVLNLEPTKELPLTMSNLQQVI